MTSICLLKIGKLVEALDFIQIAEKAIDSLIEVNLFYPKGLSMKKLSNEL